MPFFSVIIPLYNKESYIEATVKSVLNQTFSDFEVILVDDGSTDNSLEVVKSFSDLRIHIIENNKNKGLSASRNTGIKNAKANYIAFLDADDLWKPTFLEKINFLINKYPQASIFATKYDILLKNNKLIEYQFQIKNFNNYGVISNFFECNLNQSIFNSSCLCIQKSVFENIGFYNESINYSEDIDLYIRSLAQYKLAYFDKALATYLILSENQITQSSLIGKTIPDFDFYENKFKGRNDIKKYLDFQRYFKAKQFKLLNETNRYKKIVAKIDLKNLTLKQKILLKSPKVVLKLLTNLKLLLLKIGIEVNSY